MMRMLTETLFELMEIYLYNAAKSSHVPKSQHLWDLKVPKNLHAIDGRSDFHLISQTINTPIALMATSETMI